MNKKTIFALLFLFCVVMLCLGITTPFFLPYYACALGAGVFLTGLIFKTSSVSGNIIFISRHLFHVYFTGNNLSL